MLRFKAMFTRVVKELLRDKRTLALMMLAPMLVLTLMYFVFNSNTEQNVKVGYDKDVPSEMIKKMPDDKVDLKDYESVKHIKSIIKEDELDAFITAKDEKLIVYYANEDPTKTNQVKMLVKQAMITDKISTMAKAVDKMGESMKSMGDRVMEMTEKLPEPIKKNIPDMSPKDNDKIEMKDYKMSNVYVYGDKDSTFFDKIFPVLIGFFVFFFVFLISGIALLRERTTGTLNRLISTPIKRGEIVFGYLTGYGIFAIIQTVLVVLYAVFLLKLHIEGNILWVIAINVLLALVALSMGIFVSTFANSEFQMIQFIPIVVIPQVFFSGIVPLDTMASWIQGLSAIFPLTYGGKALTEVMIRGGGFADIWLNMAILAGFVVVFTTLNIIGLKRYRKV